MPGTASRPFPRYARWPALALCALGAYECFARIDAMAGPLRMFVRMAVGEHVPLHRALSYVDWSIFAVPLYALCCAVLGLCCLLRLRRPRGHSFLAVCCAALGIWSYLLRLSLFGLPLQLLKLIPLVLLFAVCVWDWLFLRFAHRPRAGRPAPPPAG